VTSGSIFERVSWRSATTLQGEAIFYSDVQPNQRTMRLTRVNPLGGSPSTISLALARQAPATGSFAPLIIPAGDRILYAMDRELGTMVRIFLRDNTFTSVPELDMTLEMNRARFVSVAGAMSFIVVDRPVSDTTKIRAREYFLGCMPGVDSLDADADGANDVLDNCLQTANPDQNDTDFDRIGDACDGDSDGDGVVNGDDTILAEDGVTIISVALDSDNDVEANVDDPDDDNDGVADTADRRPFDTDNDGVDNAADPDDDGDGYSDATESAAATDPMKPLSFPGAGYIAYIRDDGTTRTVEYAPVSDIAAPVVLASSDGTQPYNPRFVKGGALIMTLAGQPGTATAVELLATLPEAETPIQTIDTGVALRSVALTAASFADGALASITAIHPNPDRPGSWLLSDIATADSTITNRVSNLGELRSLDAGGSLLAFLGGPTGCVECLEPYVLASATPAPTPHPSTIPDPIKIRINDDRHLTAVVPASDGLGTTGYYRGQEFRPAGITELDSIVTVGSQRHLIVSGRRDASSPYELWLYNSRNRKWYLLSASTEDLVDVDWTLQLPEPPIVAEPEVPAG
jgi:hypothetical protein